MTNPLKHWDGTAKAFWDVVSWYQEEGTDESTALLNEILQLAEERAEQVHRTRTMAAAGYKAPMSLFQIQMGVQQETHDERQRRYAELCRQEIAESRYQPRKQREPHGRCPTCQEVLQHPGEGQDCGLGNPEDPT